MSRTRMARAPRPRASRGPLLLAALLLLGGAPGAAQAVDRFIRADSIHVGDGRTIEDGVVQVRDGRIVAVGAGLPIPAGAEVIDLSGHHLTPGLIDANSKVEPESLLRPMAKSPEEMVREMFGLPPEPVQHFHDPRVCPEYASHEEEVICPICGGESADPDHHGEVGVSGVSGPSAISEQSSEVIPQTAWLDAIDLDSPDFQRLLRDGVTTIYAAPDPSAVIGARGAILRTAGAERVLEREAAVKATIGSDPYRFGTFNRRPSIRSLTHFSRRPQSRMGVGWIFRKAFYDTLLRAEGGTPSGADTADPAAHAVLAEVLAGTVPLRVQARTSSDIESAYRLCGEFGVRFTLVDPVEGYRVLERIERDPVPIVFGPIRRPERALRPHLRVVALPAAHPPGPHRDRSPGRPQRPGPARGGWPRASGDDGGAVRGGSRQGALPRDERSGPNARAGGGGRHDRPRAPGGPRRVDGRAFRRDLGGAEGLRRRRPRLRP
jgi:hypothetical protein